MLLLNYFILNTNKTKLNFVQTRQKILSVRNRSLNFKILFQITYTIELEFCTFYDVKQKLI